MYSFDNLDPVKHCSIERSLGLPFQKCEIYRGLSRDFKNYANTVGVWWNDCRWYKNVDAMGCWDMCKSHHRSRAALKDNLSILPVVILR